jgi:hypothetical protein
VYWREGHSDEEGGELFAIEVPFYTFGLSLGGYAVSVEYVPEEAVLKRLSRTSNYTALELDGWYISHSDTR